MVENYDLLTIEALTNAWSIHERIWPSTYELHIIDDDGESHVFHMDALPDQEWQSLLPQQPKVSEPYVEEEEEEAEAEAPVSSVSSVSSVTSVEPIVPPVEPVFPTESTSLLPPSPTPEVEMTE